MEGHDGFEGSFNKPLFYHDGEWIQTASKEHPRKVKKGDIVSIHSAGGGGFGNPMKRDIKKVLNDYLDGIISKESALNIYGVKINENNRVDIAETLKIRGE